MQTTNNTALAIAIRHNSARFEGFTASDVRAVRNIKLLAMRAAGLARTLSQR